MMVRNFSVEEDLKVPFLEWLRCSRRLHVGSLVVHELRWFGRRVDLVTVTRGGLLIAYEFKLNNTHRALQQASYNYLAFDRSYIVSASMPSTANLARARQSGVGFIVMEVDRARVIQESRLERGQAELRKKLMAAIRDRAQGAHLV